MGALGGVGRSPGSGFPPGGWAAAGAAASEVAPGGALRAGCATDRPGPGRAAALDSWDCAWRQARGGGAGRGGRCPDCAAARRFGRAQAHRPGGNRPIGACAAGPGREPPSWWPARGPGEPGDRDSSRRTSGSGRRPPGGRRGGPDPMPPARADWPVSGAGARTSRRADEYPAPAAARALAEEANGRPPPPLTPTQRRNADEPPPSMPKAPSPEGAFGVVAGVRPWPGSGPRPEPERGPRGRLGVSGGPSTAPPR